MGHIHSDSEYDFTVSAFIVHKNRVLLLLHHKLHLWLPAAGHIELNETPIESLYREIEEETGLTKAHLSLITPFKDNLSFGVDPYENQILPLPFDLHTHTVTEAGHRHIDLTYLFTSDTEAVQKEENGALELRWFTLKEIETLTPMPQLVYSHASYAIQKVRELGA